MTVRITLWSDYSSTPVSAGSVSTHPLMHHRYRKFAYAPYHHRYLIQDRLAHEDAPAAFRTTSGNLEDPAIVNVRWGSAYNYAAVPITLNVAGRPVALMYVLLLLVVIRLMTGEAWVS